MPEKHARPFVAPMPLRVRPAMADGVGHPAENVNVSASDEASYAAHWENDQ